MKIISRAAAKRRGLKRYFTGQACRRGHRAERFVSTRKCMSCAAEKNRARYVKNPEKDRERHRAWRAKNLEKARAQNRAWYAKNLEKARAPSRARYKNIDVLLALIRKHMPDISQELEL